MEAVQLQVNGMTCGSCVKAATRALSGVPGVDAVDVRLDTGTASVRGHDVGKRVPAMITALAGAGYEAFAASASDTALPLTGGCASGDKTGGGCCCGR